MYSCYHRNIITTHPPARASPQTAVYRPSLKILQATRKGNVMGGSRSGVSQRGNPSIPYSVYSEKISQRGTANKQLILNDSRTSRKQAELMAGLEIDKATRTVWFEEGGIRTTDDTSLESKYINLQGC